MPGCRGFQLFHDHDDNMHYTVLSEWASPEDFDRFVRETGLEWVERGLGYSCTPPQYTYLQAIPHGADEIARPLSVPEGYIIAS